MIVGCAELPKSGPNPGSDEKLSATRLPSGAPAGAPTQPAVEPGSQTAARPAPRGPERPVSGAYASPATASGARAGADAMGADDFDHVAVADAVPKVEPRSRSGNGAGKMPCPACYIVFGVKYEVLETGKGYKERGLASWYGAKFHGARTSNGESYDMYAMSAAHKTLPLPTYARVTNLDNGKSVIVRINDRGPFHPNRVMDLSYAAALKLGIVAKGTGKVEVEAIDPVEWQKTNAALESALAQQDPQAAAPAAGAAAATPLADPEPTASPTAMWLQLGAFGDRVRAERLAAQLRQGGAGEATLLDGKTADGRPLTKVRLGPFATPEALDAATAKLATLGHPEPQLVIE